MDISKPLITLSCIVGNEEAVIERFIRSFAPAVDCIHFVFARGGIIQDGTKQIMECVCRDLDIRFKIFEYSNTRDCGHVDNFGEARQMAWNQASSTGCKYILWADCDDLLAGGSAEAIRAAAESGTHDVYVIPYHVRGESQIVMRERLVRNDDCAYWKYSVHEQLAFTRDISYTVLKDTKYLHQPPSTKTGSSDRNLNILKSCVENSARDFFYIQMECFERNETQACVKYARAALAAPGLETAERYEVLLNLAQCLDGVECKKLAAEAFALMPDRREALALLVNYAIIDADHEKALQLCRIMTGIAKPSKSYWSLNHDWYGWKGSQLFLQCLRLNGLAQEVNQTESRIANGHWPMFSIVHATLGRPQKALAIREMWLSRADNPNAVQYIFGLHHDDAASVKVLCGFKHAITDQEGCAKNYDNAADLAWGRIIIQAQDDCYPPNGWDTELLRLIGDPSESVFVAVSDGHRTDNLCVNTIMTAEYMRRKKNRADGEGNGFFYPGYTTLFPDTENTYRAYRDAQSGLCRLVEAREFVVMHDHPFFNPQVPWDSTYQFENCEENAKKDAELFILRNPEADTDGILTTSAKSKTS